MWKSHAQHRHINSHSDMRSWLTHASILPTLKQISAANVNFRVSDLLSASCRALCTHFSWTIADGWSYCFWCVHILIRIASYLHCEFTSTHIDYTAYTHGNDTPHTVCRYLSPSIVCMMPRYIPWVCHMRRTFARLLCTQMSSNLSNSSQKHSWFPFSSCTRSRVSFFHRKLTLDCHFSLYVFFSLCVYKFINKFIYFDVSSGECVCVWWTGRTDSVHC